MLSIVRFIRPRAIGLGMALTIGLSASIANSQNSAKGQPLAGCATLLVVEKGEAALAAYDTGSGLLRWRTPAGEDPHEIAVSPDRNKAYVTNYGGPASDLHTVGTFALRDGKALEPLDISPLRSPHGLLIRGDSLWLTAESNKSIARYDLTTGRLAWTMGTGQDRSHMLAFGPGDMIAVANAASGSVSIISRTETPFGGGPPRKDWRVSQIPTGDGTQGIDLSADGRFLWAAASKEGVVTVIDLATKQPTARISLPWKSGNRLRLTPDGRFALVGSEQLVAIDTATHEVKIIEIGHSRSEGILIVPGGRHALVDLPQEDRVAVVSLPDLRVERFLATGRQPDGLACFTLP